MPRERHHPAHQGPRRARSLWDETRKPNAPPSALIRAILYELQPIRFSTLNSSTFGVTLRKAPNVIKDFITNKVPIIIKACFQFLRTRSLRQWGYLIAILIYWQTVVYLHNLLHAGPTILIVTALIIIFTIGLGDNAGSENDGYVSAYSVFNRGFQSILGSMDADNLVAQHVGGGAAAAMVMNNNDDDIWDDNDREDRNRRHNRNQQPQQQHNQEEGQDQDRDNNNSRSRKSGKKARRKRNLEQKRQQQREIQLQRDAAAAMGFGLDGMDAVAMNRLIEEQAAAAARLNHFEDDFENTDEI